MTSPDRQTLVGMFRTMTTIRLCDERFKALVSAGQVMILYYSCAGHEAIAAGVAANLKTEDYVVTTYRGLHDHVAKGVPLEALWAEFLGRATGTCKGKGGGMHITHPSTGLMVTTGIVGGGLPIANGLALASRLRDDGRVTVCNFGDGASNIGAFHEALNLAALWRLPVVFVCQNNAYAEHTAFAHGTSVNHVADRAAAYSMPGVRVDGRDPAAVYAAAAEAIGRARAGDGPTLLEAETYRLGGHYFGEEPAYMPAEDLAAALDADPMRLFRDRLLAEGTASEEELAAVEAEVAARVDKAVSFAMESSFPDPVEIDRDVFAEEKVLV